jgi:hypothetical protein
MCKRPTPITDERLEYLERMIAARHHPDKERRLVLQAIERLRITDLALREAVASFTTPPEREVVRLAYFNIARNKLKDERERHVKDSTSAHTFAGQPNADRTR